MRKFGLLHPSTPLTKWRSPNLFLVSLFALSGQVLLLPAVETSINHKRLDFNKHCQIHCFTYVSSVSYWPDVDNYQFKCAKKSRIGSMDPAKNSTYSWRSFFLRRPAKPSRWERSGFRGLEGAKPAKCSGGSPVELQVEELEGFTNFSGNNRCSFLLQHALGPCYTGHRAFSKCTFFPLTDRPSYHIHSISCTIPKGEFLRHKSRLALHRKINHILPNSWSIRE